MSLRSKLVNSIFLAVQRVLNLKGNIGGLQSRYHATKGRILRIYITDVDKYASFKIEKGKIRMVSGVEASATVSFDVATLLDLLKGKIKIPAQDGSHYWEQYTPFDAWRRGELSVKSDNDECWLSDLSLFGRELYAEAFPVIREEFGGND
ncbi:hypothetical protein ES702_05109 [subsurface metagenome]